MLSLVKEYKIKDLIDAQSGKVTTLSNAYILVEPTKRKIQSSIEETAVNGKL